MNAVGGGNSLTEVSQATLMSGKKETKVKRQDNSPVIK